MPRVSFTQFVQAQIACPPCEVEGRSVRDCVDAAFALNERARGYFLDEQGAVRTHIVVFVDGAPVRDRVRLTDPVKADSEIFLMQALSGG